MGAQVRQAGIKVLFAARGLHQTLRSVAAGVGGSTATESVPSTPGALRVCNCRSTGSPQ